MDNNLNNYQNNQQNNQQNNNIVNQLNTQPIQNQQQIQQNDNIYVNQPSYQQEPQQKPNPFASTNKKMQNMANSYAQNNRPQQSNSVNDLSNLNKLMNNNSNSNTTNQNLSSPSFTQQPLHQNTQENNIYNNLPSTQNQNSYNQQPQPAINNNHMEHNQNPNVVNAVRAESYFKQDFNAEHNQPVIPKTKTVEQMTKALEHYYQGHLANGFAMDLFIQVTGEESFEGTLKITGSECTYISGQNNIADVTVISNTNVWKDILSGKISMQKAFMTGQVKVRGNFVLLSRFDNLFKI